MKALPFNNVHSLISWHRTGSSYICNPPVTDTDEDYIILVDDFKECIRQLIAYGFEPCSDEHYVSTQLNLFEAFRLGRLNYIVTYDHIFFTRFVAATELAKVYNFKYKEDRVNLFKVILYGSYREQDFSIDNDLLF